MNANLIDDDQLLEAFKQLPRTKKTASGRFENIWHFDLRYNHLHPPAFVLFLFQPGSSFVHQERLPCRIDDLNSGALFFPENASDAVHETANALMYAFVHGIPKAQVDSGAEAPSLFAPWTLSTEDRKLAAVLGPEFKRLGLPQELWRVNVSTRSTLKIAHSAFEKMWQKSISKLGHPVSSVPHAIFWATTDVPEPYDAKHRLMTSFATTLHRHKPPTSALPDDGKPRTTNWIQEEVEFASNLLETKPAAVVKAEADAGDPVAAVDYGIRLFHGVDCPLDRKGSRDYLVKATLSPNAAAGTQAMAHAMLVTWHIDHFLRKQSAVQRYMFAAAYHINESARIMRAAAKDAGLKRTALPEVVLLHTGGFISRFTEQAKELRWLCREAFLAEQEWSAEQSKENKKVVTKRLERPNRYKCANPECTIETTFGKVLKRCAGKCDEEVKPYYCSAECQRSDWKTHKPFCRPDAPCSILDNTFTTTPTQTEGSRGKGTMSMQMGGITINSSTLSPEVMKDMKTEFEKLMRKERR